MDEFLNLVRREVERVLAARAEPRMGRITSYDGAAHAVKVQILPEADFPLQEGDDASTGWIPLAPISAGNGIGIYAPPAIGTQVQVNHQEGHIGSGIAIVSINDDANPPPPGIQPGEFWVVNKKTGSSLRITNDDNMTLQVHGSMNITVVTGDANISVAAGVANLLSAQMVNLGAIGGKKVVRDGDPVSGGAVHATTTTVFSA